MNNGDLWDLINLVIRKEKEGGSIKATQYNNLLMWANEEFKRLIYKKYEEDQEETDAIKVLKSIESIEAGADGSFDLSTLTYTYWHHSAAYVIYSGYPTDFYEIHVVSDKEYAERMSSDLRHPTNYHPIMLYTGGWILFEPMRANDPNHSIFYMYLKKPTIPVYDSFRDSDDKLRYLQPTWSIIENGDQYDVKNALNGGGSTIYSNVTHLTATSFPYNSLSEEMDWVDEDKIYVLYLMLQKVGINLELPAVFQYSTVREQKREE